MVAIDLGAPLVGCSEVDCPRRCRVVDHTFGAIDLTNFKSSLIQDDDFTWSEGVQVYDLPDAKDANNRVHEKDFYLGSPQGFDLTANAKSSCALFFTRVTSAARFPGEYLSDSVGTCDDALTADCVNALLTQATITAGLLGNSSSTQDACDRLRSGFMLSCTHLVRAPTVVRSMLRLHRRHKVS